MSTGDTESEEKYFENPTYDGTSMIRLQPGSNLGPGAYKVPVLPVATTRQSHAVPGDTVTYDAVNTGPPKAIGKGQTYDVLDRGKVNGKSSKPITSYTARAIYT